MDFLVALIIAVGFRTLITYALLYLLVVVLFPIALPCSLLVLAFIIAVITLFL